MLVELTIEEVKEAAFSMGLGKSPGSDEAAGLCKEVDQASDELCESQKLKKEGNKTNLSSAKLDQEIPRIPYEIITYIFLQLPVKTLFRLYCVSSYLCALIDDLDFVRLHLHRYLHTKSNLILILHDWTLSTVDDALDAAPAAPLNHHPLYNNGVMDVLGSCNGLTVAWCRKLQI
ncbi:hypothetical protein Tsubulata_045779 [Turnera subulata]|uniref:F-box domain-containing protein n=1 Tax=Turnera subulata TaxID=218843 RepID=A0A9Q0F8J6_9ROSI|nr:hypothetical protein Tsubulata_045779 [Turnera subulata]